MHDKQISLIDNFSFRFNSTSDTDGQWRYFVATIVRNLNSLIE